MKLHKRAQLIMLAAIALSTLGSPLVAHAVSTSGSRSTAAPSTGGARSTPASSPATNVARNTANTTASRSTTTASRSTATTRSTTTAANRATDSASTRTAGAQSASKTNSTASERTSGSESLEAQRAATRATESETYKSLTTQAERNSYVSWHENYTSDSLNYFTDIRYFYMPGNIWNIMMMQDNQKDKLASTMNTVAKQRGYRWLRVGKKMVAVPQSIYDKVNVGDKITLVDANHIKINGKLVK